MNKMPRADLHSFMMLAKSNNQLSKRGESRLCQRPSLRHGEVV